MTPSPTPDGLVWCTPTCRFFVVTHWPALRVYQARPVGVRENAWDDAPLVPDGAVRVNLRRERRLATDDPAIEVETFLQYPTLRWSGGNSRTRRRREFLATIPPDVLRTVMRYPRHHLSLLRLAASHPHAAQLLEPWPHGAPLLAYAIAMRMAKCTDPDEVRSLTWLARRRRRAIAQALALPSSAYAVRLLGRVPARAIKRVVMPHATEAARHPHHALHARYLRVLEPAVLAVAASDCLRPLLTPALAQDLNLPTLIATRTVDALVSVRTLLGDDGGPATERERRKRVRPINGLADLDARVERLRQWNMSAQRRGHVLPPLPNPWATFPLGSADAPDDGLLDEVSPDDVPPTVRETLDRWESEVSHGDQPPAARWALGDPVLALVGSAHALPNDGMASPGHGQQPLPATRFVTYRLRGEPSATVLLEPVAHGLRVVTIQRTDGAPVTAALRERVRAAVAAHNARFR